MTYLGVKENPGPNSPQEEEERKLALEQLEELNLRIAKNKDRERIDNSNLYAGSSMYFDCHACGAEIVVPESYLCVSHLCEECRKLANRDWPPDLIRDFPLLEKIRKLKGANDEQFEKTKIECGKFRGARVEEPESGLYLYLHR